MGEPKPLSAALTGACPRCGNRTLFRGWTSFADRCRLCGLDYASFNVGDGPAAFLILLIGALLVTGAVLVDGAWAPPWWVHLIWAPAGVMLTLVGLRFAKAALLGQEYRQGAREGRK